MTSPISERADQVVPLDRGLGVEARVDRLETQSAAHDLIGNAAKDETAFFTSVTADIVARQYKLYAWNDTKTIALITVNSLLFAAVSFLYRECLRETLALLFLGTAGLCFGTSLMFCLVQVYPRLTSRQTGSEPNVRSLRGIRLFRSWTAYLDAVKKMKEEDFLKDTARQAYGMAMNNLRSIAIIKCGVIFTVFGLLMMLLAAGFSAGALRGYQVIGPWAKPQETTVTPTPDSSVGQQKPALRKPRRAHNTHRHKAR